LQLEKGDCKPFWPFKFNHHSLEEKDFKNLVIQSWKIFEPNFGADMFQFQFVKNIKQVKRIVEKWAKEKSQKAQKELTGIEDQRSNQVATRK